MGHARNRGMSSADEPSSVPTPLDKREVLEHQLGPVQWRDLQAHVLREAVFLVDESLDLLTCALAIADDDVDTVGAWIESGKLTRPSRKQLENWEQTPDKAFMAVPVQPYAIAQEVDDAPS